MLDEIRSERNQRVVFRLSRVSARDDKFLSELDLDEEGLEELSTLLNGRIPSNPIEELIEGPFRPRKKLRNKTRFSDGSFPVFYSALATETAEAEVAYWFQKEYAGRPRDKRTAYYQGFHCTFEGLEKDLRHKTADWPKLVHDSDYSFCNLLGEEARQQKIDGLIVPSVRHEGSNVPIFAQQAVSDPELDGIVAITYNPHKDETSLDHLSLGSTKP